VAAVGWDGRDVSGLTHEQIHRWTREGASPEALAAARDRHLARADELRTAADRLRSAQRGVAEGWVGRDADAAGGRTDVLAARMEELAETVSGQARGVDGMRAALLRVQAVVGPPRPPVLPGLGEPPLLGELRALVSGAPADGFAGFRAAAAEQAAAREAYRTYLTETAAAARGAAAAHCGAALAHRGAALAHGGAGPADRHRAGGPGRGGAGTGGDRTGRAWSVRRRTGRGRRRVGCRDGRSGPAPGGDTGGREPRGALRSPDAGRGRRAGSGAAG
jgi:hypothetical protein